MEHQSVEEQINNLKDKLETYQSELHKYQNWAIANDGQIDTTEAKEIDRMMVIIADASEQIEAIKEAKEKSCVRNEDETKTTLGYIREAVEGVVGSSLYTKIQNLFRDDA